MPASGLIFANVYFRELRDLLRSLPSVVSTHLRYSGAQGSPKTNYGSRSYGAGLSHLLAITNEYRV